MTNYEINIEKKYSVTQEDIDNIMVTAFEGGITYWCEAVEVVGEYLGEYASDQIARGGKVIIHDDEGESHTLDKDKLLNGIKLAIEEEWYANYEWYDVDGLDTSMIDAEVADSIIQFALFGCVVYG